MALTTAALADALDRLSRLATVVLNEHLNTDSVCDACGGEAWPCHPARAPRTGGSSPCVVADLSAGPGTRRDPSTAAWTRAAGCAPNRCRNRAA